MPKNSKVVIEQRRESILRYLSSHQNVSISEINNAFEISEITARRDLSALIDEGMVSRTSSGLYSLNNDPSFNPTYFKRYSAQHSEKVAIANAASQLVSEGDVISFDGGTTTLELSKKLAHISGLTVITNNFFIPLYLTQHPSNLNIEFLGGAINLSEMATYGAQACKDTEQYNITTAFFSADGLDLEEGLSSNEYSSLGIKMSLLDRAEQKVLLIDSSKIGRRAARNFLVLSEIDVLVTDYRVDANTVEQLKSLVKRVIVAE